MLQRDRPILPGRYYPLTEVYIPDMELPIEHIVDLIPQKAPFVMVGKLLQSDEESTKSSFRIQSDNIFVRSGLFQEAGLMENIAQTAALRAGYAAQLQSAPVAVGYIGAVNNFEIFDLPKVGDEIITSVSVLTQVLGITVLSGEIYMNDNLLAKCEMKVIVKSE